MRHHSHQRFFNFAGRHHGGRGGMGRFGKGFMDGDDMGGRAFGMGRKLASADLQLIIVALLAEKPRHGYEIIKALDEKSKGFYVPSPGMVYPALTYLEELGHATVEADGARKRYHLTEAGQQHFEDNRAAVEALFTQFVRVGERMERVRRAMNRAESATDESGAEERGSKELRHARRELKAALADKDSASEEEQRRIVQILQGATAAILGE